MSNTTEKVVIAGGGFTGLFSALYLRREGFKGSITLIDQETRFIFKPLLYDLLSQEVQVDMVWPRYDELLLPEDIAFVTGKISSIDMTTQTVALESGLTYSGDYLVMALGNTTGYFGIPGAKEHSFSFRAADDAFELGKHLRQCLQQAQQDQGERDAYLTVAIVGAGPSGIELASTLGDLLPTWYDNLRGNIDKIRIVVLQRGNEILQNSSTQTLRETANRSLRDRQVPVEVVLGASVSAVTPEGLDYIKDHQLHHIDSKTVVWTAGNTINPVIQSLPIEPEHRCRQGQLKVHPTLQLPDYPNVFTGGDCAVVEGDRQPATAQVAYQQGLAIAKNIIALNRNEPLEPAKVNLRGTLLKLGMNVGVAEIFDKYDIKGHPAHLIRQAVYLNLLPTPARNLKQDAQWLTDEVFEQVLQV